MHYYQFNIGDYASHTAHLDPIEDAAYRRMMDYYYLHEKPLPPDIEKIAKLIRMREHCKCIADVLQEFFVLTESGYLHQRIESEIKSYRSLSSKRKKAANKRWSSKHKGLSGYASALQTPCNSNANQEPRTKNQEPRTKDIGSSATADKPTRKKSRSDYPDDFEAIWQAYPKREGANPKNKAYSAYKARLKEGVLSTEIAAGVARYGRYCDQKGSTRTEFVMQAQRFFGKERAFENDWIITEATNAQDQRRTGRMSKSEQADEALRRFLEKHADHDHDGESVEALTVLEDDSFGR